VYLATMSTVSNRTQVRYFYYLFSIAHDLPVDEVTLEDTLGHTRNQRLEKVLETA
jgi:hypothetical protein